MFSPFFQEHCIAVVSKKCENIVMIHFRALLPVCVRSTITTIIMVSDWHHLSCTERCSCYSHQLRVYFYRHSCDEICHSFLNIGHAWKK